MKKPLACILCLFILCLPMQVRAQRNITPADLEKHTLRFSLSADLSFDNSTYQFLEEEVSKHHFVGLAELHRSQQLSYFTTALLKVLARNDFNYFALEIGPYSAMALDKAASVPGKTKTNLQLLNKTYGNKLFGMAPLVFLDRQEDALFVEQAARSEFEFWGLDQEFIYSFEMHLDTIYAYAANPSNELQEQYRQLKKMMDKWGNKAARSKKFRYNCQLLNEPLADRFFNNFKDNPAAVDHINALRTSWDIYCKNESGKNSNQQRANYMKANFDTYYEAALKKEKAPKVFVKMGSVHLTKGKSPFGVEDLGKHLQEKAAANNTGFLNIRHIRRYRNGKDLINDKAWSGVRLFMETGKKDEWTLIDLRPVRKQLEEGKLTASKNIIFEINSYDFIVIPPDDKKAKPNF